MYKGHLSDGSLVAVKRLKDCNIAGGEVQFQTEVETISLALHRNLLRLRGFCSSNNERILVYPYMPNGSVASRLKGKCSFQNHFFGIFSALKFAAIFVRSYPGRTSVRLVEKEEDSGWYCEGISVSP